MKGLDAKAVDQRKIEGLAIRELPAGPDGGVCSQAGDWPTSARRPGSHLRCGHHRAPSPGC